MSFAPLKPTITNKTWLLAFLLTLTALAYGIFEVVTEQDQISDAQQAELADQALRQAQANFNEFQLTFSRQAQDFISSISENSNYSPEIIEELVRENSTKFNFWGVSVFKDDSLWIWNGFGAREFATRDSSSVSESIISLERSNNVTYLSFQHSFSKVSADTTRYHFVIRKKMEQENILPIGNASELSAEQLFQPETSYPVRFSFFESISDTPMQWKVLSTQTSDSVGLAYTLEADLNQFLELRQNQYFIYRAVFYALIILLFTLFLISFSQELTTWNSLFLKLIAVLIAWLFFANIDYGVGWIQAFGLIEHANYASLELLIIYCIHSFFIFLIAFICYKPVVHAEIAQKDPSAITLGTLYFTYGLASAFLFYFFLVETYTLIYHTQIPVLDLDVIPAPASLIFYIASGLFGISAVMLLILVGWFILKLRLNTFTPPLLYILAGFSFSTLFLYVFEISQSLSLWMILVAAVFFLTVLIFVTISHLNPTFFKYASRLRMLLLFSYISVCLSYVAVYKGYSDRLNVQMKDAVQLFAGEQSDRAEQITRNLLINLEQSLSGLTEQDINNRPDFVESLFTQLTQQHLSPDWERFSISTQLITNSGETVGEYSSNLDSPAWTKAFNMFSLIVPFETEQIRQQNLRPIIRERPLNEANSNYSTFRRGWIPLYENETNTIFAWILTSVYREQPQFEKPLRAVIAFEGNRNWNASINITEYVNGISARTNIVGPPIELPANLRLSDELISQVQNNADSSYYRVTNLGDLNIREYFTAENPSTIIRSATTHPGFDNHLFSVIRFFFCVFGTGLIGFGLFFWKKEINIFGQNKRFRDRLIDRFILASLICLMALMTTTYYAISSQTQQSVQDQLLNKLSNLTEAITLHESQSDEASQIPLTQLSSTLDADAALYRNQVLDLSTTSQIYSQNLLPQLIPWDVYQSIMERGNRQVTRKVTLGDQQLLIGYQPWLNENSEIAGIVSIPTFLDAPKFNEQLLSTTSLLLGLYVLIFGFFILGAALISTQLTAPLEALRDGLRKITGGNLETTLPVKSKDEIGALTNAYNVMVYRLKDLQDELARAEREAAWKEMAQQVAHEIKNPLTPMKLNLQHLERQLKASKEDFREMKPKVEKIAANMIEQIESLSQIASDFSKFAKPTEQEFKEIEINELVQSVADLYEPEKKLAVKTKLHSNELWVSGVKEELRRVLINLVKNAFEAMAKRGTVTLTTSLKQNLVIISVEDDGEGIPEASRDQIFVPNFSTKSSGTGLGLAITKKIIQEHDGEITFTSEVGVGTTFVIRLPKLDR